MVPAGQESARLAQVDDAGAIAALASDYLSALQQARGGSALIKRVDALADPEAIARLIVAADAAIFVGLYDGLIAGFAHLVMRDEAGLGKSAEVDALYIDPPLRRVGVGEAMIDEIARAARQNGAAAIDVITLPGDGATKSFLEATGFRARLLVMHRDQTGK